MKNLYSLVMSSTERFAEGFLTPENLRILEKYNIFHKQIGENIYQVDAFQARRVFSH